MADDNRIVSWINALNVISWKTVVVGILQSITVFVVLYVWARKSLDPTDSHDMHPDTLNALLIFLAGLSGITLGGLAVKRTTDIDYQLAKNQGKSATNVQTGDNPVNVTSTQLPVQPAVPLAPVPPITDPAAVYRAPTVATRPTVLERAGPRAIVTDNDDGVL